MCLHTSSVLEWQSKAATLLLLSLSFSSASSLPLSCSLQRRPQPIVCLRLTLCSSQPSALPSSHFQPQRPSTHPEIHCPSSSQSGFISTASARLSVPLMSSLLILSSLRLTVSSLLLCLLLSAAVSQPHFLRFKFLTISDHYRIISNSYSAH